MLYHKPSGHLYAFGSIFGRGSMRPSSKIKIFFNCIRMTSKPSKEELDKRLEEFALAFKDDPDFQRLPFPEHILKKLGLYKEKPYLSVQVAVDRCLNAVNNNSYTNNVVEVIDQTGLVIDFPPLPLSSPPIDTSETKTQQSEDSSSPPACDDAVNITLSA